MRRARAPLQALESIPTKVIVQLESSNPNHERTRPSPAASPRLHPLALPQLAVVRAAAAVPEAAAVPAAAAGQVPPLRLALLQLAAVPVAAVPVAAVPAAVPTTAVQAAVAVPAADAGRA